MLDRQNKELHAKLAEAEAQLKTRTKAAMQALEGKIANLEEQLDAEARLVQLVLIFSLSCLYRKELLQVTGWLLITKVHIVLICAMQGTSESGKDQQTS